MADMIGVSIVLVLFASAFPAYLTVLWRTWPGGVERARERLERTPGRSLALGVMLAALLAVPMVVLLVMPNGVAQFLGYTLLALALAYAGIGAAGFATRVGGVGLRGMLIGAAVVEFAMALPVIGWFVVTPLLLLASLGAGTFALLRWRPRAAVATPAVVTTPALATEPH